MAHDFANDEWEEHNTQDWDTVPASLWDDVTDGLGWQDDYGKMLFDGVFVDPVDADTRQSMFDALREWMDSEYGIDFDAEFDWEGWREWYG